MSPSSWGYYARQQPCRELDYYLGHDQDPGLWLGRGLDKLGLELGTEVSAKQLEALFGRALNPQTGLQLGRAWRADGVTGYDLTFSAPKSVSALLADPTVILSGAVAGRDHGRDDWFGPELPGSGPAEATPILSRSMQSMLTEDALDAAREQGRVEAVGRTLASLQTLNNGPSGAVPDQAGYPAPSARPAAGVREVVVAAHDTATRTALAYLDTHAALSRRGTDGVEQVATGGFTVAAFTHYTSREGDPQLHTHALVLNKVQCEDGSWRALDGHEIYAHKKSAGMIYQAVLRNELVRELGIAFEAVSKDGQAEILGIPEPLLSVWSKRTHAVNAEAATAIADLETKLGRSLTGAERAAVTKTAVLKTRPDKTHEQPQALTQRWAAEAAAVGIDLAELLPTAQWAAQQLARDQHQGPTRSGPALDAAALELDSGWYLELAGAALTAAGRGRAVFGRADVAGQVAALLPATGMTAAEVLNLVERVTDQALQLHDAVGLGAPVHGATHRASDARYATVEVLQAEARILALADTGRRSGAGQVHTDLIRVALAEARGSGLALDRSQVEAIVHLTSRGDTLDVLTAPAGAGKTATLGTCAAAWQAAGYRVIGLAPSARAAAELHTAITQRGTAATAGPAGPAGAGGAAGEVGSRTDTLAKWLHSRAAMPDLDTRISTGTGSGAAVTGRGAWARLDARTVLLVDEASMASTLDLDTVTQAAARAGAKVVLVGDPAQIGVINGPGGMLATLAADGHALALTAVHRFSQEWEKQASLALRDGHPDALAPYTAHDRLHPCADGDEAADRVFAHWQHTRAQGADALMLARTRLDVDELNLRARAAASAAGQLTGPVTSLGGREWQAGDVLRTRKNNRRLPLGDPGQPGTAAAEYVRNGDRWRVLGLHPDGGLVVEDLAGRGRVCLPAAYVAKHCEYGWAATIDGSQGATCDVAILLARPGLDREHLYVAMTRGRHANHAYLTPDPALQPEQHTPARPGAPRNEAELERDCRQMLQAALASSGAQDSATLTLRKHREMLRRQRENQPVAIEPPSAEPSPALPAVAERPERGPAQRDTPRDTPRETELERRLTRARAAVAAPEQQRQQITTRQRELWAARAGIDRELGGLPRWAVGRRRSLTAELDRISSEQPGVAASLTRVEQRLTDGRSDVEQLGTQVREEQAATATAEARAYLAERLARAQQNRDSRPQPNPPGADPRTRGWTRPTPRGPGLGLPDPTDLEGGYGRRHGHGHDHSPSRDTGYDGGLSR